MFMGKVELTVFMRILGDRRCASIYDAHSVDCMSVRLANMENRHVHHRWITVEFL